MLHAIQVCITSSIEGYIDPMRYDLHFFQSLSACYMQYNFNFLTTENSIFQILGNYIPYVCHPYRYHFQFVRFYLLYISELVKISLN